MGWVRGRSDWRLRNVTVTGASKEVSVGLMAGFGRVGVGEEVLQEVTDQE